MVDKRRHEVAPDGRRPTRPQQFTDPAFAHIEHRQGPRRLTGKTRPGRDDQLVILEDPDRHVVHAERAARLFHDRAEEVLAVMRRGEALGDPEDRVEPLGELGL